MSPKTWISTVYFQRYLKIDILARLCVGYLTYLISILGCRKEAALSLTPVTGQMVLSKIDKNGLKDLLHDFEPFEIITDDENNEIIDQYIHHQRILRGNPVRFELIKYSREDFDKMEEMILNDKSESKLKQAWPSFNR